MNLIRVIVLIILIPTQLSIWGCSRYTAESTVFDAILALPDAERDFQQVVIDFSNPSHYKYLGTGWNLPQPGIIPYSRFLWSSDIAAFVQFPVNRIEPLELLISVRPFVFEGSPPVTLSLEWNSKPIGRIELTKDWDLYRLELPESVLKTGDNVLFIHQSQVFRPSDVTQTTDTRVLGASYAYIIMRPLRPPLSPENRTISQVLGEIDLTFQGAPQQVICDEFPASFVYRVDLPSRPILDFGAGILPDSISDTAPATRFAVRVRPAGTSDWTDVFQARMHPPRRMLEMGWKKYRRNLESFANQTVDLQFETTQDPPGSPGANLGSWLTPVIINEHLPVNIVMITGSGSEWPPRTVVAGSDLEKLYSASEEFVLRSTVQTDIEATATTESGMMERIPFDLDLVRLLQDEGWAAGYFVSGRNIAILEDMLGRELDALVGYSETNPERGGELVDDSMNWAARLEERHFVMVFDWNGAQYEKSLQEDLASRVLNRLFAAQMELSTLFIVYNTESGQPMWFALPENGILSPPSKPVGTWDDFSEYLLKELGLDPTLRDRESQ